jgi:hypothetical protein
MKKQNSSTTKRLIIHSYSMMLLFLIIGGCNNLTDVEPTDALQSQISQSETATFSNAQTRVDVCHLNGKGEYSKITVADAAFETHIEHGDGAVGDPYPGMTDHIFGDDCEPIFDGTW